MLTKGHILVAGFFIIMGLLRIIAYLRVGYVLFFFMGTGAIIAGFSVILAAYIESQAIYSAVFLIGFIIFEIGFFMGFSKSYRENYVAKTNIIQRILGSPPKNSKGDKSE